jgi:peptidyl-dipeptidase Dcp
LNYCTFAKETDGIETLEKWDGGYSEKLKQNYLILMTKIKALFPIRKGIKRCFTLLKNYMD